MSITVGAALARAAQSIDRLEARVLLGHVVERDAAYLLAHADEALEAERHRAFVALVGRRRAGEPVAYLTRRREFYGLEFKVSPAVLIPRPETELLVDLALESLAPDAAAGVLDLGTGSGCIAVTIAKLRPRTRVVAIDKSQAALAVAAENAAAHGVANVEFRVSEWYSRLAGERFDLIVANPPYIAPADPHLTQGDVRCEPMAALVAEEEGLACLRAIAEAARAHLVGNGRLLLEHGYRQAAQCRQLLTGAGFAAVFSRADIAGIERVSGGRLP